MKFYFVSGNAGKYIEVKDILAKHNIEVEHIKISKPEIDADKIEDIAVNSAEELAKKLDKTIIVEDTGFFLNAFENFPGSHAKFVISQIGIYGIFKLLEGKSRDAYFKCCAAYCEPGQKARVFTGIIDGQVSEDTAKLESHPQLPYDSIFIPEGCSKPWADIIEEKANDSHRLKAFNKLAEWLKANKI